jgi:ion channel POLLUX/CASTOR
MPRHLRNRVKFLLERLLVRGAHYRLLVIVLLILLMSLSGGILVYLAVGDFADVGDAVWWAFLRLTDPGYLGDDEGTLRRGVSTILTVAGYVVFLGALVAIMTQWLNQTIRRLETGLTPVAVRGHFLILGWTSRTATIVRELLQSEGRVRRFLGRRGTRAWRVVVLVDEVSLELLQELRDRVGVHYDEHRIILRSGSPLRVEHLRRVAFLDAAAIVLPAADPESGQAEPDTRTLKTLLSISTLAGLQAGQSLPLAVAEFRDERKLALARQAYGGPLESIAGDSIVSRLIAQNIRHPGLSLIHAELLTHGRGNEIYVRECPELTGERLQDMGPVFPGAIVLGVVRRVAADYEPMLNPPPEFRLGAEDRLVLLARHYEHTAPGRGRRPEPGSRGETAEPVVDSHVRRVAVFGWSEKVPALIGEFDRYAEQSCEVDVLSLLPTAERMRQMERRGISLSRTRLRMIDGDITNPVDVQRIAPGSYDTIVFVGSDRLESGEEADARTMVGYLLLRDLIADAARPHVVVELLDPGNASLLRRRRGEVLVSPLMLSHILAQVVLRHELRSVFEELFGPAGAEIFLHPPRLYEAEGEEVSFADLQAAAAVRGEIALGVRLQNPAARSTGGLQLNPPRTQRWRLGAEDDVIVLTTYAPGPESEGGDPVDPGNEVLTPEGGTPILRP